MKFFKPSIQLFLLMPCFFTFYSCGTAQEKAKIKMEQNPPFTIESATSQKWVAGTKEGGEGTNLTIKFIDIQDKVLLQNIYFQNNMAEAKISQQNLKEVTAYFRDKQNKDVIMDSNPMKEVANTVEIKIPFQLNEKEAVLEYLFNGKKNYFKIVEVSKLDMLPYPSSNKN